MREQEKKFIEKKKAEMAAQMHADEMKEYEMTVAPAMAQAQSIIDQAGDSVSDASLEALALWKLGK